MFKMFASYSGGSKNQGETKAILDFSATTTDAEKVQALRDLWKVYEVPAFSLVSSSGAYLTSLSGKFITGQGV